MSLYLQHSRPVAQGQITQTVYSLIRYQRFTQATQLLEQELQVHHSSRGSLRVCHTTAALKPSLLCVPPACPSNTLTPPPSQFVTDSRPGLSLLAYCYYHSGAFEQAAST